MNILDEARAERSYLISLRRHLHSWPETAMQEQETASYIRAQLDAMDIPYRMVGETGILAQITGKITESGYAGVSGEKGRETTVLLRADIDALPVQEQTGLPFASQRPGFMHACGHDLHTAALIGAAKILRAHEREMSGRVLLAFQPSEENGSGHRLFLEDPSLLGPVNHVFGLHVAPEYPAGSIAVCDGADAAEVDWFTITIRGRSAHISKPSRGIDALYIAVQICQQLRALATTLLDPMQPALIGVGRLSAGTAPNVIANEAALSGTVRCFSPEAQQLLCNALRKLAEDTAGSYGAVAEVEIRHANGAVINNPDEARQVYQLAGQMLGEEKAFFTSEPVMGMAGDDFSAFLDHFPGAYAHVGVANVSNPNSALPLHDCRFEPDEEALVSAAAIHAAYAMHYLSSSI